MAGEWFEPKQGEILARISDAPPCLDHQEILITEDEYTMLLYCAHCGFAGIYKKERSN